MAVPGTLAFLLGLAIAAQPAGLPADAGTRAPAREKPRRPVSSTQFRPVFAPDARRVTPPGLVGVACDECVAGHVPEWMVRIGSSLDAHGYRAVPIRSDSAARISAGEPSSFVAVVAEKLPPVGPVPAAAGAHRAEAIPLPHDAGAAAVERGLPT